jgi:hypothetical protein
VNSNWSYLFHYAVYIVVREPFGGVLIPFVGVVGCEHDRVQILPPCKRGFAANSLLDAPELLHFRFQVVVDVLERRIVFVGVGFHGFVVRISDLEEDLFVVAGFLRTGFCILGCNLIFSY